MDESVPSLPSPDESGIAGMPAPEERTDSFAAQHFEDFPPAPHTGALLSVAGVGLFCFSLLLTWFPQQYSVGPGDMPGWLALLLPLMSIVGGLAWAPGLCVIGLIPCALEGVSLYILGACVVALFKPAIPKRWHFYALLLATFCFFLGKWYLRIILGSSPDLGTGYWVALGSFVVVLVGLAWQMG